MNGNYMNQNSSFNIGRHVSKYWSMYAFLAIVVTAVSLGAKYSRYERKKR